MVTTSAFAAFAKQKTVLLTTYRRNGIGVGTPVNIAVEGDRAFFRTFDRAGKVKRIRNDGRVSICPCTIRGRPTGPAVDARARLLSGQEAEYAGHLMARKYPIVHGLMIPAAHRMRHYQTRHYELTLAGSS